MHRDWFILLLLLPTPTIWFSLDHPISTQSSSAHVEERDVSTGVENVEHRKRSRKKWKRSNSSDSDSSALMTPLTTPMFDFH